MSLPDQALWRRLGTQFDALLELATPARQARLDEIAAVDPALADELCELLAAGARAEEAGFLNGVALEGALDAALDAGADEAQAPSLVGRRFGAYELVAPLGQGGSGTVWRARRADGHFDAEVAVKLLHLSLLGQAAAARFRREGAILATLEHPHIARLLDAGVGEQGQPYLVLERVDGEPIDRWCDARCLRLEQRVALFADVLAAVAHAHRYLVVHRDLKPANVLVDRAGQVKLLDFGIARLVDAQGSDSAPTAITREGARALTPDFAAPEQLRGDAVTTAADVYALGVMLYLLLAGRHPTAPAGAGLLQVMHATLEAEPVPLDAAWKALSLQVSEADVAEAARRRGLAPAAFQRALRGDLANIVACALRKDPAQRYASADALADDLRRALAHEPVRARAHSARYRAAKFVRRNRGAVAAAALVGAVMLAGVAGTLTQARRADAEKRAAQVERDRALRDLQFANASRDLLGLLVSQGKAMTGPELLESASALAERQFADDPLTRGRLQLLLGIEYGNAREFDRSKAVLERARSAAVAANAPDLLANVECLLASTLGDQLQPDAGLALFATAIARLDTTRDSGVLAACLHMRADLHAQLGKPEPMLADAQAALALLGTPRPDQRVLANSIGAVVAEAYGRLGRMADAVATYEASVADLEATGRGNTTRAAVRLNNFSRMLYQAGQWARAAEVGARGVEITRAVADAQALSVLIRGNTARALGEIGRHEEARSLVEQAMALATERHDLRAAGFAALYGAPSWCAAGDLGRCGALVAQAGANLAKALPPGHVMHGAVALAEAQWRASEGNADLAQAALLRAEQRFAAAAEATPLRWRVQALLATSALGRGDLDAATRHADTAVRGARAAAEGFASSGWLDEALAAQRAVAARR